MTAEVAATTLLLKMAGVILSPPGSRLPNHGNVTGGKMRLQMDDTRIETGAVRRDEPPGKLESLTGPRFPSDIVTNPVADGLVRRGTAAIAPGRPSG